MKNPLTGFICTCLLVFAGTLPGRAQEQKPGASQPAAVQTAPPTQVAEVAPDAATADADAPAPASPPQDSPQQTPPSPDDQPTQHSIVPQPPPLPVKVPDVRRPGESGYWIGLVGWFPTQHPFVNGGAQATFTGNGYIQFQGKPRYAGTIEVGAAAGLHNTLKFSYTEFQASGNFTANTALVAWGKAYIVDTYMATQYHVQAYKISYEFLTWPYPVGSRKFRLKTLWQAQYINMSSSFDSPLDYYNSNGNLIIDPSTQEPIDLTAHGTRHIIAPAFGIGLSYYPSRHLRLEANGSGFGFPHRYAFWGADADVALRVSSHFEVRAGGVAFAFKTSTNSDYYLKGTWASAFVGVRWYSNSE